MQKINLILIFLVISSLIVSVSATHTDAIDTATKAYNALQDVGLPYQRNFTQSDVRALGFPNFTGTYDVYIKTVTLDTTNGTVDFCFFAWRNGTSLAVHNPWGFYIPYVLAGNNNQQRLNSFLKYFIRNLEDTPLGNPIGDDAKSIYPTADADIKCDLSGDQVPNNFYWADGTSISATSTTGNAVLKATTGSNSTPPTFDYMWRYGETTNSSILGTSITITLATYRTLYVAKQTGLGTNFMLGMTQFFPASNTTLVSGDYDTFGTIEMTPRVSTFSGNMNFTMYSPDIYVSKTAFTNTMIRISFDLDNNFNGTWASGAQDYVSWGALDHATESTRPYWYFEYTTGGNPPVAAFSANVTSGYPPFDIAFTDASTNTPTSWSWLFGDGETDTAQNPVHKYDSWIGNSITLYDVNESASNAYGSDWENKSAYITAYPLNASFTTNKTSGCAPCHVGFTDATNNGTPSAWSWFFGGDGTASTQSPSHVFNTPGSYWVMLNASNAYSWDQQNYTPVLITVYTPTTAAFSANVTSGCPPLHVSFTDSSTGESINNWTWDFNNDGTPDSYTQNPVYIYSSPGTYTVNLTVTGSCGTDSEVKSNYVTVSSGAPTADFTVDNQTPWTGQTITFTDLSTGASGWSWDFNNDGNPDSTSQNPSTSYASPGLYSVKLTATNGCGSDDELKTDYINVTAAPPTPTPTPTPTQPTAIPGGSTGGKIPTTIYILLMFSTLGLILYTFIDLKNKIYGNIVAGGIASLCSFILALFSSSGLIGEFTNLIATKSYNASSGITDYAYENPLMVQDLTMMYIWALVGGTMFLFTAYLIYEAYKEKEIIDFGGSANET